MIVVETRKESYDEIVEKVQAIIQCSDPSTANSLQRQLDDVTSSWNNVVAKANEEGEKLSAAVQNATQLDEKMNDMDDWLSKVEATLAEFQESSTILETLEKQQEQIKVDVVFLLSALFNVRIVTILLGISAICITTINNMFVIIESVSITVTVLSLSK